MNTVEDNGLSAEEQVHVHWLPVNFRLETGEFITPGEQQG